MYCRNIQWFWWFLQIIKEGYDINERDCYGVTALWYAAREDRYEMARILIEHKADLEVKDKYGNTPLSNAVFSYKIVPDGKLIKLLVDAGADVNSENNYGVSPLGLAKTIGDFPYLDILEKKWKNQVPGVLKCLEGNTISNPVHTSETRMCGG